MQLARLSEFVSELSRSEAVGELHGEIEVYWWFNEAWYYGEHEKLNDATFSKRLQTTLTKNESWRDSGSTQVFFPVKELAAVVVADFAQPPNKNTRVRYSDVIRQCLSHSSNAFDATHDALTGLLNRSGFEREFGRLLAQSPSPQSIDESKSEQIQSIPIVALLALDLDHFKQINDTYGHLYGDVVLKCFARRLESACKRLGSAYANKITLRTARFGGEEFTVLLVGSLSRDESLGLAEEIRKAIAELEMPSPEEWDQLDASKCGIALPRSNERTVTVSIGVAVTAIPTQGESSHQLSSRLSSQADAALYRAKSGGRNSVRNFDDILTKYGRVLEHHADTNIVAIDIGRQINVNPGQEFQVFHPDFTGSTSFVYTDGRTKKRLGVYPKTPCARIVAFDVQNDVSFCKILDREGQMLIPHGSVLEAVPMGSIAHLVESEARIPGVGGAVDLHTFDEIQKQIESEPKQNHKLVVAVFTIQELSTLSRDRGVAFVNHSLARLYSAMRDTLPASTNIGQIQSTNLAVVFRKTNIDRIRESILKTLSTARERCGNHVRFAAGIYSGQHYNDKKDENDKSDLVHAKALDFARYAVSEEGRDPKHEYEIFSADTAVRIISAWRKKRSHDQALVDYKKLRDMGMQNAHVENLAGLCALENESKDLEFAYTAFLRATELQPNDGILHANLGLTECARGNYILAHGHFSAALNCHGFSMPEHYKSALYLSEHGTYMAGDKKINATKLLTSLEKTIRSKEGFVIGVTKDQIRAAITELKRVTTKEVAE